MKAPNLVKTAALLLALFIVMPMASALLYPTVVLAPCSKFTSPVQHETSDYQFYNGSIADPTNAYDGNWGTAASTATITPGYVYENYSWNANWTEYLKMSLTVKAGSDNAGSHARIRIYNYSSDTYTEIYDYTGVNKGGATGTIHSFDFYLANYGITTGKEVSTLVSITEAGGEPEYLFEQRLDEYQGGFAQFINATFMDELSGAVLNGTIDSSTWQYHLTSNASNAGSFLFSNLSYNYEYDFCGYPANSSLTTTANIKYASLLYPQREWSFSGSIFTNSTTNKTLYLLNSASGIYTTYQVVNVANSPIPGATVVIQRMIGGTLTTIGQPVTDSAGAVTFWNSPTTEHTITVIAPGYATKLLTITPTQSIYTIQMGSSGSNLYYNSSLEGIYWSASPSGGILEPGVYNFTFYVNSTLGTLQGCSLQLLNANRTLMNETSGCNANGGTVNFTNYDYNQEMFGKYMVQVNGFNITLEADAHWINLTSNLSGPNVGASMQRFLSDMVTLPDFGTDAQTRDFNILVMFFGVMAISLAIFNKYTQFDSFYPGMALYGVTLCVIIGSLANGFKGQGLFYLGNATQFGFIFDNWILAILFILISASYFFSTHRKYT